MQEKNEINRDDGLVKNQIMKKIVYNARGRVLPMDIHLGSDARKRERSLKRLRTSHVHSPASKPGHTSGTTPPLPIER